MSVVYGERGLSSMEFWRQARILEKIFMNLLLHDFGIKSRSRQPEFYASVLKMEEVDAKQFADLCEKYHITKITDRFPEWMIETRRTQVLEILQRMKRCIRDANEVYPYYESEFYERRKYQDDAIRACGELYDVFTACYDTLPIDADRYDRITIEIEKEATLLKGWRKSDNRILKQIRNRR
jgi:hypothetical protein